VITLGLSGVCAVMNCCELMKVLAFELFKFSQDKLNRQASFETPIAAS
jgi:hypothetical protein